MAGEYKAPLFTVFCGSHEEQESSSADDSNITTSDARPTFYPDHVYEEVATISFNIGQKPPGKSSDKYSGKKSSDKK